MSPAQARLMLRLYPSAWRERFGDELQDLLKSEQGSIGVIADIARAALVERVFRPSGLGVREMQTYPASMKLLVRRPIAFVPIAMSLAALTVAVITVAIYGTHREQDEGAAAHMFQLLVAGQLPVIGLLLLQWRQFEPKAALRVLTLQVGAIATAMLPVWMLQL